MCMQATACLYGHFLRELMSLIVPTLDAHSISLPQYEDVQVNETPITVSRAV